MNLILFVKILEINITKFNFNRELKTSSRVSAC